MDRFLARLEDIDNPLLGPSLCGLESWGLWQKDSFKTKIYNAIHIFAFVFVLSQYIELWIIRNDLELALRNLSITMLSTICVFKAATFVFWQNSWKELVNFVSDLEKSQLSKNDKRVIDIIEEYTKYSRKVTYFYWCLVTATVFTVILTPLVSYSASSDFRKLIKNGSSPYPEIMSSWVPFDRTRGIGYWVTTIEQALICFYGGGVVASVDSNAVVLMTFFTGQLKILSMNCARMFGNGDEEINDDETVKRIKECHYHHLHLVNFSSVLNSLLSPVMFLYVVICSLMICASAVQLMAQGTGNMQRIWIAEYLIALIAQLFLYCWHSNEVLHMSDVVDDGVYKSSWWSQNIYIRRNLLILAGQLRRPIILTAGPFTRLNVATFIAILKGSYSFFTLLDNKEG